jgi:hypothetical protein
MLSCNVVAVATHARYGVSASAATRECGQITIIDHTMVTSTTRMSAVASGRF